MTNVPESSTDPMHEAIALARDNIAAGGRPFGAVVVRSQAELGLSDDVVNPHGGGIAIGHPIGASGNRLVVHAVHELVRRGGGTAAVALCGGGGQGDALILTR